MLKRSLLLASLMTAYGCSEPNSPKLEQLKPKPPGKAAVATSEYMTFNPKVDILFVVDDSNSMDDHQTNLAKNIDLFLSEMRRNKVLDYHIGVLTTSMTQGGAAKVCCGALVGTVKYVTKKTPDGMNILAENLMVGINGDSIEKSFDPIVEALSAPLVNTVNNGFYRDDAALTVVFVTDAEDQSTTNPNALYNFLLNLKNNNKNRVFAYGAIVPSDDKLNCARDGGGALPVRIETFLKKFQNNANEKNFFNLCDQSFGEQLGKLGFDMGQRIGRYMYLNQVVKRSSIKVWYGNKADPKAQRIEIPANSDYGWSYDSALNAIVFGPNLDWDALPPGLRMEVEFETADFGDQK